MNIQKISNQMAFNANTKIVAPEKLLSKENKALLEDLGNRIGKSTDSIEFSVSDLHIPARDPNAKTYTVSKLLKLDNMNSYHKHEMLYEKNGRIIEKNSPFNYIKGILERYL